MLLVGLRVLSQHPPASPQKAAREKSEEETGTKTSQQQFLFINIQIDSIHLQPSCYFATHADGD